MDEESNGTLSIFATLAAMDSMLNLHKLHRLFSHPNQAALKPLYTLIYIILKTLTLFYPN